MLEVGKTFEGKYEIRGLLGAGGFALVYKAYQPEVDRYVAIKVLRPAKTIGTHPATLLARFQREAKMAAELRNEHNISLFDFGRTGDGLLYMIFEFVDGKPLDEFLKSRGAMSPALVVQVVTQLLTALSEAHRLGILHRDVKPQNIILFDRLGRKDQAKLIDYGIAKPMGKADEGNNITAEGHVVGTPRYMAPEQILMLGELTPATDIYSLGLVAYEMLAGRSLLGDSTHTEVIKRQLSGEVFRVPPTVAAPPGLRRVIDKMLAKSVRDRYPSADDVIAALAAVDPDEPFEKMPSVDQILTTLAAHSQERGVYEDDDAPRTVESRPMARVSNDTAVEEGAATMDSRPTAHLDDLRDEEKARALRDAARAATPSVESVDRLVSLEPAEPTRADPPKRRMFIYVAFAAVMGGAFVSAAGVGFLMSRSSAGDRIANKVSREIDQTKKSIASDCDDDELEPNDRSSKGTMLETGEARGVLCPGNVDWFRLGYHEAGDIVSVGVEYDEGADDIDLELFVDADFEAGVWTPKRVETLTHKTSHSGIVAVRLYYPKVESEKGRGYRITRDLSTLAGE